MAELKLEDRHAPLRDILMSLPDSTEIAVSFHNSGTRLVIDREQASKLLHDQSPNWEIGVYSDAEIGREPCLVALLFCREKNQWLKEETE